MTFEKAEALLEDTDGYLSAEGKSSEKFIKGIEIMAKYDDDIDPSAEHDIIYLADFSEDMPKEEILELHRLGFHLDGEGECWAKFA